MKDEIDWLSERMTPAEVAALLDVSEKRLANMRSEGVGPKYYRPQAGKVFYLRRDVYGWLLANPVRGSATRSD
jgi:hypothetical protein